MNKPISVEVNYKDIIERLGKKKNIQRLAGCDVTFIHYEYGYMAIYTKHDNFIGLRDYVMLDNCKLVFFNLKY